jgi:hypothetical protein
MGAVRGVCGDPLEDHAFVLADGLYQRSADQWWRWSPSGARFDAMAWVGRHDGACARADDYVWVADESGQFVRVGETGVASFGQPPGAAQVQLGPGSMVIAEAGGELWLGPDPWSALAFEAGDVQLVSAAGDSVWVAAGDRLFRMVDSDVTHIEAWLPGTIDGLWAHAAGGAWIESGGQLCHQQIEPLVRVRGLRPYEHRRNGAIRFTVLSDAAVQVELDGAVHAVTASGGGRYDVVAELDEVGWHRFDLRAGGAHRAIDVKRVQTGELTWVDDIAPLFAAHCAGGPCHGPSPSAQAGDARADLSTYAGWVENRDAIVARVGGVGDMPVPASRLDSWGPDEVAAVLAWIDGGMVKGDEP